MQMTTLQSICLLKKKGTKIYTQEGVVTFSEGWC